MKPPRAFVFVDTVARHGSIRKAAEHLNIASTAVNKKIIDLETELGTPIFERVPKGVRLTAAGEVLVAAIRRSLGELRAATGQIEQLRGLVRGHVRLGCAQSVALGVVPRAITKFQQLHPGVTFSVTTGVTNQTVDALLRDDNDLILVHDPPTERLDVLRGIDQPLCAIMRADHPLAGRSDLRLSDCQPYRIAIGDQSFQTRALIEAMAQRLTLKLDVALEANSVQTLLAYTLLTGAISFQYRIGICRHPAGESIVAVPLLDPLLHRTRLVLASRVGRVLPMAALSFVPALIEVLDEDAAST